MFELFHKIKNICLEHDIATHAWSSDDKSVLDHVAESVRNKYNDYNPVSDTLIIDSIRMLNGANDDYAISLVDLLPLTKPTTLGISRILELMRSGGSKCLSLRTHSKILQVLCGILTDHSPPHVKLLGNLNTFIQLPSLSLSCPKGYTFLCWIRFEELPSVEKCLFRCRNLIGEFEVLLIQNPNDDHCSFIVRTICQQPQRGTRMIYDARGVVKLQINKWLLFSLQHAPASDLRSFNLNLSINGVSFIESSLKYPFDASPLESTWACGIGLRLSIACITFYASVLTRDVLKMILELGPEMSSVNQGVCVPQSSFDTGHTTLGILLVRGEQAEDFCKTNPVFSYSAYHFADAALHPHTIIGRMKPEHIEMVSRYIDGDGINLPILHGSGHVSLMQSWKTVWLNIGGTSVVLYLLSDYCSNRTYFDGCDSSSRSELHVSTVAECISGCFDLIGRLVALSIDIRDKFIQEHGFHVLSQCLSRLDASSVVCSTVDMCIKVVQSFGVDSLGGDGITSALQGLLMNPRLWNSADRKTRAHLFTQVCHLTRHTPNLLYRAIGTQKVLDFVCSSCSTSCYEQIYAEFSTIVETSIHDAGYDLLSLVIDGAIDYYGSDNSVGVPDIEYMISALDNIRCSFMAQRVLLVLQALLSSHPHYLYRALCDMRYAETTALHLMCDGTFAIATRRTAFMFTLWTLKANIGQVAERINVQLADLNRVVGIDKEAPGSKKSKNEVMMRIRRLLQPVEKAWLIANMLSERFNFCQSDHGWLETNYVTTAFSEFLALLRDSGPLGEIPCCLALPLLSVFISKVDLMNRQESLMSLAVGLKTNDAHVVIMSLLPDMSYVRQFLALALDNASCTTDHQWANVGIFGDCIHSENDVDILSTCFDISLDALSQILVFKVRYQGIHAWDTFKIVMNCLRHGYPFDIECKCLRKITSLCLQKLARNRDNWNIDMMEPLAHIFSMIQDRMLCGKAPSCQQDANLLEISTTCGEIQSDDEKQLLSFVMDALNTLCRAADGVNFGAADAKVLIYGMKIMAGCLLCVCDDVGNRLCNDLQVLLCYATERWRYMQCDVFKDIVLELLNKFRNAIHSAKLTDFLRSRYSSAVVLIVDYFTRLPYGGSFVPPQALSLVDVLGVAENVHDVDSIFMLLHVHLYEADSEAISFVEDEDVVAVSHQNDMNYSVDFITPSISDDITSELVSDGLVNFNDDKCQSIVSTPFPDEPLVVDDESVSFIPTAQQVNSCAIEQENQLKENFYRKWIEVRYGILQDRVDSENLRKTRALEAFDFAFDATVKFWKSLRRKIETELFYDEHVCEWKLGVAHEGYFPSRKRVVLRPRYDGDNSGDTKLGFVRETHHANSMTETELRLALTRVAASRTESVQNTENVEECAESRFVSRPISGWGVVDADGSEEGYGVVGLALDSAVDCGEGELDFEKSPNDVTGDIREIEEGVKYGRDVETGPCHSGTRRIHSGATLYEAEVMLVTASGNCIGTIAFTNKDIFFASSNDLERSHLDDPASVSLLSRRKVRRRRWTISTICAIYQRRFRHRDSALEVFFHRGKHRNFFVDFGYTKADARRRDDFAKALMLIAPRLSFKHWPGMSTYRLVNEHGVQDRWLSGELSNFDYLMALNTIAGRTYNDLSQYTEPTIDLTTEHSFRDLSRPIGALNADRLKEFVHRYNTFNDPDIPPFMYGSHYSTMVGVVLHYLVRLQPFASLHKDVQNGRFDVSDRLFSSIPRTWEHNTSMLSEVKELTPEWYSLPDFLRNLNGFDFGQMQDDTFVDDVELPPWAVTPEDFVRINREALESPYVSAHLHEWIDLIFGYKQRGSASVEANNVFYFLTYYGSVNPEILVDDATRRAIELQIAHFGQCPTQLFRSPHPAKRKTAVPRLLKHCFDIRSGGFISPRSFDEQLTLNCECTLIHRVNGLVVCNVAISPEKVLCVLDNGVIESYCFGLSAAAKSFLSDQVRTSGSAASKNRVPNRTGNDAGDGLISFVESDSTRRDVPCGVFDDLLLAVEKDTSHFDHTPRIPLPFRDQMYNSNHVCISQSGRHIFSFGRPDGGVAVREVDVKSTCVVSAADYCAHRAPVCCLATDEIPGGATEVVVSCDITGRILVWTVSRIHKKLGQRCIISRRPQREFRCHEDSECWCDISWQLGIVATGSRGLIHIFSIERNEKLRIIDISGDMGKNHLVFGRSYRLWNLDASIIITKGVLCDDGVLVILIDVIDGQKTKQYLAAYSVNGQRVGIIENSIVVTALCCPAKGAVAITGHSDGSILFFNANNLELLCEWKPHTMCKRVLFGGRKGLIRPEPHQSTIKHIAVGPNAKRPSMLVATTESGEIYLKTLPDYIKWEKTRSVSALSQLVSGPMQAVRGTLMQASDAAGVLATNAKSFAGETLAKAISNTYVPL